MGSARPPRPAIPSASSTTASTCCADTACRATKSEVAHSSIRPPSKAIRAQPMSPRMDTTQRRKRPMQTRIAIAIRCIRSPLHLIGTPRQRRSRAGSEASAKQGRAAEIEQIPALAPGLVITGSGLRAAIANQQAQSASSSSRLARSRSLASDGRSFVICNGAKGTSLLRLRSFEGWALRRPRRQISGSRHAGSRSASRAHDGAEDCARSLKTPADAPHNPGLLGAG